MTVKVKFYGGWYNGLTATYHSRDRADRAIAEAAKYDSIGIIIGGSDAA